MTDDPRLRELANRLVESGPKAAHVSASECHEISEGLHDTLDQIAEMAAARDELAGIAEKLLAGFRPANALDKRVLDDRVGILRKIGAP